MDKNTALSLSFDDEELYENLIYPCKKNRKLSDLVVKLLTVYYYNENVRIAVDSDGMFNEDSIKTKYDDYFKNAYAFSAIMSSALDSVEDTLRTGINNIIDTVESRDDIDEDVWGAPIPNVSALLENKELQNVESIKSISDKQEEIKNNSNHQENDRLTKIENTLEKVLELLGEGKIINTQNSKINQVVPISNGNEQVENVKYAEIKEEPKEQSGFVIGGGFITPKESATEITLFRNEELVSSENIQTTSSNNKLSGRDRLRLLAKSAKEV